MNGATWLTLLGALGIPVIVTALFKLIENKITLRSAQPRSDAEALDIGIGSQWKVIETLESENARLAKKIAEADLLADAREQRYQARIDALATTVEQIREDCRRELTWQREETGRFRRNVENLLAEHHIEVPDWWYSPVTRPEHRHDNNN